MISFSTIVNKIRKVSDDITIKSAKPRIGHMVSYMYNPKTKDKLPYYDLFPLIIVVDYAKDGFYGINFHYLNPKDRLKLLKLVAPMNTKRKDLRKIQISYATLKGLSNTIWKPTFKRYLFNHIRTKIIDIPVKDWKDCIKLPTIGFQKSTAKNVHAESRKMY